MWTMDQLVQRVASALAAEYPGAPNGRVREVPDRRSIRWYTTIGLVDRPIGTSGRQALYGPRHLLQLVAIKRRQAAGRSLAEIQAELAGASDEDLAAAARVPAPLLTAARSATEPPVTSHDAAAREAFWRQAPAAAPPTGEVADATTAGDTSPDAEDLGEGPAGPAERMLAETLRSAGPGSAPANPADFVMTGLNLGDGVILLVPHPTADIDRGELTEAARPLLDLLASRGLTDGRDE